MKHIAIILIALAAAGCATQKRCLQKFPPVVTTDTTYVDSITYRDTSVTFVYPGVVYETDSIFISPPIADGAGPGGSVVAEPAPSPLPDTLVLTGRYATSRSWVAPHGRERWALKGFLTEHEHGLQITIDSLETILRIERIEKTELIERTKHVVKWYHTGAVYGFFVLLLLWLVFILLVVLRR